MCFYKTNMTFFRLSLHASRTVSCDHHTNIWNCSGHRVAKKKRKKRTQTGVLQPARASTGLPVSLASASAAPPYLALSVCPMKISLAIHARFPFWLSLSVAPQMTSKVCIFHIFYMQHSTELEPVKTDWKKLHPYMWSQISADEGEVTRSSFFGTVQSNATVKCKGVIYLHYQRVKVAAEEGGVALFEVCPSKHPPMFLAARVGDI